MEKEPSRGEGQEESSEEIPKIQPIRKPWNVTALATCGLLVLAVFYTLYVGRQFFIPLTLAWMLGMLLKPAVRGLKRIHIPEVLGSAILLIGLIILLATGFLMLSEPVAKWVKRAPETFAKVEEKIRSFQNSADQISKAAASVEHITKSNESETPTVELKKPGLLNQAWSQAKGIVIMGAEVFVLLFFFLASGDIFALKLIQILPRLEDKKRALEIARETQKGISHYLLSMTLVNLIEGTVIGTGLALMGMPNPLLWGVVAFSANYIPYLGPMIAGSIVTVVALVSFDSVSYALLAPAIYFGVNFTDNFLSPYIVGHRLVLNPLVVFVAVMFWGWLWGIVGVLLGVPITMAIKIICDYNPVLAPFAEFLTAPRSEKSEEEPVGKPALVKGNA
jgi:predicted PurR-regulated permease PerM